MDMFNTFTLFPSLDQGKNFKQSSNQSLKEGFKEGYFDPTSSLYDYTNDILKYSSSLYDKSQSAAYTGYLTELQTGASDMSLNLTNYLKRKSDLSGNGYLGQNVKFDNDHYAYITQQGVVKPYDSSSNYFATVDKNGCGSATNTMKTPDISWNDVSYNFMKPMVLNGKKYIVGSDMVSGQSCGHEGFTVYNNNFLPSTWSNKINDRRPASTYIGCNLTEPAGTKFSSTTINDCSNSAVINGYRYFSFDNSNNTCRLNNTIFSDVSSGITNTNCINTYKKYSAYDNGSLTLDIGQLAYIDEDSRLYNYPTTNRTYPNPNSYTYDLSGIDISGANTNIDVSYGITNASCAKYCNDSSYCVAYVFDSSGNICYRKNSGIFKGTIIGTPYTSAIYMRDVIPSFYPIGVSQTTTANITTAQYKNYAAYPSIDGTNIYGVNNGPTMDATKNYGYYDPLQDEMEDISKALANLSDEYGNQAITADQQTKLNSDGLESYFSSLEGIYANIKTLLGDDSSDIQNRLNDSDIIVLQKNYEYLCWIILAIGIVLIAMNVINH